MTKTYLGWLAGATMLTGLCIGQARAAENDTEPPAPPQPPREAVEACASSQEGATCTMTFHGRRVQGICQNGPEGQGPLACMPPPPPEAVTACANLGEGADCKISKNGRDLDGKCRNAPNGTGPLACVPPPPRHR